MATCFNRYYPISQQKGYVDLRGLFIVGLIMGGLSLSNLVFAGDATLSWSLENNTSNTVYLKFFSEKGGE
ncbi:MAG: hypothetical protein PHP00_01025 [Thiotrichaceae bacterium]|nr:hypothetical protein [Thiotrichaceae bacterium]